MKLKERIPDDAALNTLIEGKSAQMTQDVRVKVGSLEADYIKYRRQQRIGFAIITAAFLVPNIVTQFGLFSGAGTTSFIIGTISFLACVGFVIKFMFSGAKVIKLFHSGVDRVLFFKAFELLGVKGELLEYAETVPKPGTLQAKYPAFAGLVGNQLSPEAESTFSSLRDSELITEPFNRKRVDNRFEVYLGSVKLAGSEIDIKHETGSGKNRSVKHIFSGYFISCELSRTLEGKTFVSTEGDESGFGHKSFFSGLNKGGVNETILEWNQFENLLHVATNSEVEARYILTTNFMSDLYTWWQGKKGNIRIAFIGNHMYMLFPDTKIRFDRTIAKINEKEVKEYVTSISLPLLHVLHLAEDVGL
jgi:hypothetical protein